MTNEEFQTLVLQQLQSLNEGQKSLAEGQVRMETRIGNLEEGQARMENRLDTLEHKTDRIDSSLVKLEARIENEVIDKIRGLFDDRSMNQDYFASIKDSLARVEDRVEFLARQNIEHLNKLQKHDRELRLLRTEKR
jgi:chaperonin cofactor prefoldin